MIDCIIHGTKASISRCPECPQKEVEGLVKPEFKEHESSDHKCSVGCPIYNSGHSIDVNGYCNMGCC